MKRLGQAGEMTPEPATYPGYRFPAEIIGLKHKPRRLVTDGLRSYGVARREILPEVRHRTSRYLNNRAENSHRPTR
jgi:putative transposase